VVVFVISGASSQGQTSQVEMAGIARAVGEERPQIIVACCNVKELGLLEAEFATIVQLPNYAPSELELAAELMFQKSGPPPSTGPKLQSLMVAPRPWAVEVWKNHRGSFDPVYELWLECVPRKFHLSRVALQSLLERDGYGLHYVVREPETREILGFCATYTTYIGSGEESLIGSVAAILVRPSYRKRGVGRSLHDHALWKLSKTRGVERLQLGSTFPRLLFGLPVDSASEEWYRRRGWRMDQQAPGTGHEVTDWFLQFNDWFPRPLARAAGLVFRPCDPAEFELVLELVERESARNDNVGWYDQYAKLTNSHYIREIVIGIEDGILVASALTFINDGENPVSQDIPWPAAIGHEVGGLTCICIAGMSPDEQA
jgi:GNAT superfamily N-acetyltransferase